MEQTKYAALSERTNARKRSKKSKNKSSEAIKMRLLKTVQQKTGLPEKQVRDRFEEFMRTCPAGEMTKKKFVDLSREALGEEANFLADSLFRVFDEDNSGTMDFAEYMLAINATNLDSSEEKLKWMFNVFDKDGGGTISGDEIQALLRGLFEMSGQEFDEDELKEASKGIMEAIDSDGDGEVTRAEFINNASKSEFIASMLK